MSTGLSFPPATEQPQSVSPRRFPTTACALSIIMTSLGLAAAALDIQWGTAHTMGDALRRSWEYAGIMWMLTWLVGWPVLARPANRRAFLWDFTGIVVGATPALGLSAFFSQSSWPMIEATLAVQLGVGIFVLGILSFASNRRDAAKLQIIASACLVTMALAGPVLLFVYSEFFPAPATSWTNLLPLVAVQRLSQGTTDWLSIPGITLWVSLVEAGLGVVLFGMAKANDPASPPTTANVSHSPP